MTDTRRYYLVGAFLGLPRSVDVDADVVYSSSARQCLFFAWHVGDGAPPQTEGSWEAICGRVLPAIREAESCILALGPGRPYGDVLLSLVAITVERRALAGRWPNRLALSRRLRAHLVDVQGAPGVAEILRSARSRVPRPPPSQVLRSLVAASAASGFPLRDRARGLVPFGTTAYRNGEPALEILVRGDRIHAHHPAARWIGLFAVARGEPVLALTQGSASGKGVAVEVEYAASSPTRIVALATNEDTRAVDWCEALQGISAEQIEAVAGGELSDSVHARTVWVHPPVGPRLLRLREDALPSAHQDVTVRLLEGAAAGARGAYDEAASAYASALDRAGELGDESGRIKATLGMALALNGGGFEGDATRAMQGLIADCVVDRAVGAQLCRAMVWRSMLYGDIVDADRWAEEAARVGGASADTTLMHNLLAAAGAARWGEVHALAQDLAGSTVLSDAARAGVCVDDAFAMAALGMTEQARRLYDTIVVPKGAARELRVRHLAAGVGVDARTPEDAALAASRLWEDAGLRLTAADQWAFRFLLRALLASRSDGSAALAVWDRFVTRDSPAAQADGWLALTAEPDRVLRVVGRPGPVVETIPVRSSELRLAIDRLVSAVVTEEDLSEPAALLRALLLPPSVASSQRLVIASDGVAVEMPWPVLLLDGLGRNARAPALTEVAGGRSRLLDRPRSTRVVSIADAFADLPHAGREVREREASVFARGGRAVRTLLLGAVDAGLLHLGLHARRVHGLPTLFFADGALTSLDIRRLRLESAPVVLLSGCATGTRVAGDGVERSLADAFLHAGASAVVASRWPLSDAEGEMIFRPIVAADRATEIEEIVSACVTRLRRVGYPARVWAAPVVYRR